MKVFIAGPRAIKTLNKSVKERLSNILENNFTIFVGDANGIDKQIQQFCFDKNYKSVKVFASNGKARNNIGNWEVENVTVPPKLKGFDFYAAKDLEMARVADYGFMIWNGKSKGTLNNIFNLVKFNKKSLVYLTTTKQFYVINNNDDIEDLKNIIETGDTNIIASDDSEQMKFF